MKYNSVLMVVAKYPATHGHTTVINSICNGLKKLGYRVGIGAFSFTNEPPQGISMVKLNKKKLLLSGINALDFDIIHSHQARVNYYLLHRKPNKPVVFHYHGASDKIQQINFIASMKLYKKRISKIIAVSRVAAEQIRNMIGFANIDIVFNGVDTQYYNTQLPQPYKKGKPQLIFVGALRKYKKVPFLIGMMPKLLETYPNTHLQIVGDGEDFQALQDLIKKKNLQKNVELTGKLNGIDLQLHFSSSDLYVSASTFETLPVPTLEALACGKPLVLSDHPAHLELIRISQAGLIFSSENFDICDKIVQVYKNSAEFGRNARKFAEKHNWSNICSQISNIYEKL